MIENEIWEKRTPKGMVRIRFAERDDLAGILAVRNAESELTKADADDYRGNVKKGAIVAAVIEDKVIGFSKWPSLIIIRRDFRKVGIGRALATFSIKFAKETKYELHFMDAYHAAMLKIFVELEKIGLVKIEETTPKDNYNLELTGNNPHQRELKINTFRKTHGWKIVK